MVVKREDADGTRIGGRSYPSAYTGTIEPYYPVNEAINNAIFDRYRERTACVTNVIFGGRLASYRYYDMDMTVGNALTQVEKEFAISES